MSDLLLDTHALIWFLEKSPLLTTAAANAITASLAAGHVLYVSAVSLVEILYLEEKGRLATGTLGKVMAELSAPEPTIIAVPFEVATIDAMARIPRQVVPDMPDRMIAGTALQLGLPLVTADQQIRAASLPTIW